MLIHPLPDPIALKIGPIAIHWYGLMYLIGFLLGLALGHVRVRQPHMVAAGWKKEHPDDLLLYIVVGIIVGGRLGEVLFYHPVYYLSHPLEILAIWRGGMSFHGGALGVVGMMWLWARKNGMALIDVLDFIGPLILPGYITGRIGNFINAELPGRVADAALPWAMIWPNVDWLPRHPSPIYQALIDGVIPFVVLWLYARRPRPHGAVCGLGILMYGCARFFTEYFRTPDYEVSLGIATISAGQMLSLPMIAIGGYLLWQGYRNQEKAS